MMFYSPNCFSQINSQVKNLQVSQKSSTFAAEIKIHSLMKNKIFFVLALMGGSLNNRPHVCIGPSECRGC